MTTNGIDSKDVIAYQCGKGVGVGVGFKFGLVHVVERSVGMDLI